MAEDSKDYILLPHHEQSTLCATRLPYRQGRKLTAVKVYSINNESRHLLIFGVPSLNLRQETKALFLRFGKLLQFNLTKYPSEQFTETYHAVYENIQSSRIAKKMLDTKNYYGGNLHICYAPELESVEETRDKLLQRQKNVLGRLKNLETSIGRQTSIEPAKNIETHDNAPKNNIKTPEHSKVFMGNVNNIQIGKRKENKTVKNKTIKKSKPDIQSISEPKTAKTTFINHVSTDKKSNIELEPSEMQSNSVDSSSIVDVVDFTSPNNEILTNINETLNYDSFGTESIRAVPYKPVNKIKFNLNKRHGIYFYFFIYPIKQYISSRYKNVLLSLCLSGYSDGLHLQLDRTEYYTTSVGSTSIIY